MLIGVPLKIVQNPGLTLILYEEFARKAIEMVQANPASPPPTTMTRFFAAGIRIPL